MLYYLLFLKRLSKKRKELKKKLNDLLKEYDLDIEIITEFINKFGLNNKKMKIRKHQKVKITLIF